jgi:hypothetical protein
METEKWDWAADDCKGDVIIPQVNAVAVYQNGAGDVVIRQRDPYGDEDSFIVVPVGYLPVLISALSKIRE